MLNPYESSRIIQFVCDDAFIKHQLAPTRQSTQFWDDWFAQHPDQRSDWEQAVTLLKAVQTGLSDYSRTYLSEEAQAQLLDRILATNRAESAPIIPRSRWQTGWFYWSAAACLLLAIGISYWYVKPANSPSSFYQQQSARLEETSTERINSGQKPEIVRLPDGSLVVLAPQSRLRYPASYGQQERSVFLLGEATFDVLKNPRKPFYVYADKVITRVLGTRFIVRSFDRDPQVVVQVQQGHVSVYKGPSATEQLTSNKTRQGVLLLPNQQVVFSRETETFTKTLVDTPQRIDTKQPVPVSFVFDETPVARVFATLEKAYGIDIVYDDDVLEHCQLTASLTEESLFQKLDVIVQSIDASYTLVDGQVVINAKSCTP
ncbi:FecR domain-containing protein [Spirosoma sp. BT702]|uniref:FecR domain-containing protein n=1 Tax=Spirosoma profusum TaxID=2771354 RepID=A0A926XUF1_9BACT|nr:FecR family protein [Spirosoma profusum]MBD2700209.1 FecR domain-containing protein [Spirosoma profusum]